ncbi:MAG: Ig-like domain-containing protein [Actinomycetota bacterium]
MILLPATLCGQRSDFSGLRIFINPGHGGNDGDDRHMIATDFWESEGNLTKGLFLRHLLEDRNATVYMSRTTNYTSDDLPLSTIATMANTANADIFISIHSNGFDGTRNQPLVLFRGYDNAPVSPAAKTFAHILWAKLYEKGNCWTHSSEWVKGDWTFYPDWGTQGLGVLRTLNMPGVLSEGSFHDYIPEGWRLRNENHLHHEAWAMLRAFQEFYSIPSEPSGIIAGTVRDMLTSPPWYFRPGTRDQHLPVNGATVTLMPSGRSVTLDDLNNGFFLFDSVPPGNYQVISCGMADFYNDTLDVNVVYGRSILADFLPSFDTVRPPVITEFLPVTTDSLPFNQVFTMKFNLPMDREAVEAALILEPAASVIFEWDDKCRILTISPVTGLASKTPYLIRVTTAAASKWDVHLSEEYQVSFVTRARPKLVSEQVWPPQGATGITLFPRITLRFDAPLDQVSAKSGIRLLDGQSAPVGKKLEIFSAANGKGNYSFELSSQLQLNTICRLEIDASVKDIAGVSVGSGAVSSFTTRTKAYQAGNIVESFDNIPAFWDPEASGSTVGTDNPLTTFTASTSVIKSAPTAGRLDYVFTGEDGGVCRVFNTAKPSVGSNASQVFAMWVYGDLSYNELEYWFYSPGSVNRIVPTATINWAGWDLIAIPFSSIGGSGDWQYHSIVVRQTGSGLKSGTMFFDDAMVITPTGIEDQDDEAAELAVYPNPVKTEGTVSFILQAPSEVNISLYASDGSFTALIFAGDLGAGNNTVRWHPSPAVAPGIYSLRLGIRNGGETPWHYYSRQWVILR